MYEASGDGGPAKNASLGSPSGESFLLVPNLSEVQFEKSTFSTFCTQASPWTLPATSSLLTQTSCARYETERTAPQLVCMFLNFAHAFSKYPLPLKSGQCFQGHHHP